MQSCNTTTPSCVTACNTFHATLQKEGCLGMWIFLPLELPISHNYQVEIYFHAKANRSPKIDILCNVTCHYFADRGQSKG